VSAPAPTSVNVDASGRVFDLPQFIGHHAVVPPILGTHPGSIDPAHVAALHDVSIADLSDEVGRLYTFQPGFHLLRPSMPRVIGTALTVKCPPGDNWAIHGAFELVTPGTVVVVDWRGTVDSCGAGAAALHPPIQKGLAGIVVDGAWRDLDEAAALGFPIIGLGETPYSSPKAQTGEINVPISCGGVIVQPGDLVVGDSDGVVVVPRAYVADVVAAIRARLARQAAAGGESEDVATVSGTYWRQFEALGGQRVGDGERQ